MKSAFNWKEKESSFIYILRPEVVIKPEDGLLNMGSILIKEEIQKTFTV